MKHQTKQQVKGQAFTFTKTIRPSHIVEFYALLGGGQHDAGWDGSGKPDSRLAILPNATHYDIFSNPALASAVLPFLEEPLPQK